MIQEKKQKLNYNLDSKAFHQKLSFFLEVAQECRKATNTKKHSNTIQEVLDTYKNNTKEITLYDFIKITDCLNINTSTLVNALTLEATITPEHKDYELAKHSIKQSMVDIFEGLSNNTTLN